MPSKAKIASQSILFEVTDENRAQVFDYIRNNPWVDLPKVVAWWLEQGEDNKRHHARKIVRSLTRSDKLIHRTSETLRGPHGGFAFELHAKGGPSLNVT